MEWPEPRRSEWADIVETAIGDLAKEKAFDGPPAPTFGPESVAEKNVLWRTIWGSHMWGMQQPESDVDLCVVYARKDPGPVRNGLHRKGAGGDEHWYELGRVVELLRQGSLTMLYGVMSPCAQKRSPALEELRALLVAEPRRAFMRAILRDTRDSEKAMARADSRSVHEKHLRIACRNLRCGITLFQHGRCEFVPSDATEHAELHALRAELHKAYEDSALPDSFPTGFFDSYLKRWSFGAKASCPT